MLPGTKSPELLLTDWSGDKISLSDFSGKLIYLHFTRVSNPICRQHLDALKKLPEPVKKEVQFIQLIRKEEQQQQALIEKQNWPGKFYMIDESSLENWKVKNFPASFLIDEKGKLLYSPAMNPLDGFTRQIGQLLQKRHMEKMRNQSR